MSGDLLLAGLKQGPLQVDEAHLVSMSQAIDTGRGLIGASGPVDAALVGNTAGGLKELILLYQEPEIMIIDPSGGATAAPGYT